jgi:hypothetical protein
MGDFPLLAGKMPPPVMARFVPAKADFLLQSAAGFSERTDIAHHRCNVRAKRPLFGADYPLQPLSVQDNADTKKVAQKARLPVNTPFLSYPLQFRFPKIFHIGTFHGY